MVMLLTRIITNKKIEGIPKIIEHQTRPPIRHHQITTKHLETKRAKILNFVR